MNWVKLDKQMAQWSNRLISELKITEQDSRKLATMIASEVRFLSPEAKTEIKAISPVKLSDRLDEVTSFQGWMDMAHQLAASPFIVRAQVITQNYVCFVYLPESCFRILFKALPNESVTTKCAQFLSNNPVRAFRNAIAHANWSYRDDFNAIIYWARKGNDPNESLEKFEVTQKDLTFWQSLSRCVAYTAFSNL